VEQLRRQAQTVLKEVIRYFQQLPQQAAGLVRVQTMRAAQVVQVAAVLVMVSMRAAQEIRAFTHP
jgi:hypothetical protein